MKPTAVGAAEPLAHVAVLTDGGEQQRTTKKQRVFRFRAASGKLTATPTDGFSPLEAFPR
jgi:hypothetical protein